jgi:hypothetical protein
MILMKRKPAAAVGATTTDAHRLRLTPDALEPARSRSPLAARTSLHAGRMPQAPLYPGEEALITVGP